MPTSAARGPWTSNAIAWDQVPQHPLPQDAIRALRYMQDIESHTIIYLRTLLDTRAIDDPEVATFLACWLYEETFHGIALARFVRAAGYDIELRPRSAMTIRQAIEARLTSWLAMAWPDFVAVHMTWGAINELTTLTGYRRLAALVDHPVLRDLLDRIVLDESRHFYFYFKQAELRLRNRGAARVARAVIERFWAPVGSGVQPVDRDALSRALPVRRPGRSRRGPQGRRDDPRPARALPASRCSTRGSSSRHEPREHRRVPATVGSTDRARSERADRQSRSSHAAELRPMVAEVLELVLPRSRRARGLEHDLLLAREVAAGDVEQRTDLLAQHLHVLQPEHRADLLIHELVLVAKTLERSERAGVLLVRLKEGLVLDRARARAA